MGRECLRKEGRGSPSLGAVALVAMLGASFGLALALARPMPAGATESQAQAAQLASDVGAQPLTPWHKARLRLPDPRPSDYVQLAEQGVQQAGRWHQGGWYCELLHCPGRYPMLTIWGGVRMFEAANALELAAPSAGHLALVNRFAHVSERYWNRAESGYAPYPDDRAPNVEIWFDDNGWLGLAFVNAYIATHDPRYLDDAQRAFHFIAAHGWDAAKGGGMWWTTRHPYHSGPALASDTLLGMQLYELDHESWQLQDAKTYVDWANANDDHDERQFYLEKPNNPNSVNDYVQSPLVYAQYLLCKDGAGEGYCRHAARLAATLAEQNVTAYGYHLNYGPQYDSIYLQWMMAYGQAVGDSYWTTLAQVNASAAAAHVAAAGAWLGSWWGGRIRDPETHPDMFRTMASTSSLFAWTAAYSDGGA
jgi:Glycosyl hydrolase family 76